MRTLILARHAHAESNAGEFVNSTPPGGGLSDEGREESGLLGSLVASDPIDVGFSSRLLRTQETLALALATRSVPRFVEPLLDEIGFGSFDGGSLAAYRRWAWENEPDEPCPGGGESRTDAARRFADALSVLLARPEETLLVVSHALPIRYVIDASDGRFPAARLAQVAHATPFRLERDAVHLAAEVLRGWAEAPRFADTPFGG
ncbi:MAG: histidine phosphatase family protein [Thermoleophilia bacterium]|nr:histidine phosphatase family protein [Thermoleophilia bacterium]